ncbi:MAG: SpoIID/LytB domain-containing protein, partial [Firmicutes bacterium]|nr:SpoIID/LytB domain-containing protein [Bacillota bacterium]
LPNLRVGLRLSQPQVTASAEGPHQVVNLATGALIATGQANQVWSFSLSPQGVAVASQGKTLGVFTGPIVVRPLAPVGQGNFVRVDGARYRGILEVYRGTDGLLSLVNVLPLEEYLYGVVPAEMPSDWPLEALKAQAVAARTYARQRLGISQPGQGFDICATKYCQVYLGVNAEKPAASQAVDATRGLVLTYNGQLISAFFHASGGGYTENSENVWGEALPYLRGVPDFDQASPHFSWTAFFTPQEIQDALSREGYDLGRFYNLMPAGQPGVSGRWTTLKLEGSKGDEIMKATELRRVLNLKSTLFRIIQQTEGWQDRLKTYVSTDSVVLLGGDGRRVAKPVGMVTVLAGGSSRPVALADGRGAAGVVTAGREMVPTGIRLEGHGWGHGVGLSQWGARAMAEKGNNFQTILKYYYQGVNIEAK